MVPLVGSGTFVDALDGQVPARKPAVLLVGHGAENIEDSCRSIRLLAARLSRRPALGPVEVAFIHGEPSVAIALERLAGESHVLVVPMLAAEGHYSTSMIPDALKAAAAALPCRTLQQTAPLGLQPAYTTSLASRMRKLSARAGIDASSTTFLAIGHGSRRIKGAIDDASARLAQAMSADFATSEALYLDCAPMAASWRMRVATRDVVVAPVLFSDARHASEDVPRLFGLGRRAAISGDEISLPWLSEGRRLWYAAMPPVTACVVSIVAGLARDADPSGRAERNARMAMPGMRGLAGIVGAA